MAKEKRKSKAQEQLEKMTSDCADSCSSVADGCGRVTSDSCSSVSDGCGRMSSDCQ